MELTSDEKLKAGPDCSRRHNGNAATRKENGGFLQTDSNCPDNPPTQTGPMGKPAKKHNTWDDPRIRGFQGGPFRRFESRSEVSLIERKYGANMAEHIKGSTSENQCFVIPIDKKAIS